MNMQKTNTVWLNARPADITNLTEFVVDHTTMTSSGKIAYVNLANNQGQASNVAELTSNIYNNNATECIQFWYILSAENPGHANLSVVQWKSAREANLIWSTTNKAEYGEKPRDWRLAQMLTTNMGGSIFSPSVNYILKIRASADESVKLVAIDDLSITNSVDEKCPPPADCTFESYTFCNWARSGTIEWQLIQGRTDTADTGPDVDVTTGTDQGVYAYLESSEAKFGDEAELTSAYFDSSSAGCFSLWYFMHGADVYRLNVFKVVNATQKELLSRVEGEQGAAWFQLAVNVASQIEFKISIEAIVI
jgi:hypothetical protein